jgi:hypothetical protein
MNSKSLILLAFVSAALLPAARATDIDIDIRLGHAAPPPPPQVVVVEPVGPSEPPPWTKPRAFHTAYSYYYYPESNVYYRADNHTWFYLEGRNWHTAVQLPSYIRVNFGRSVPLRLDTSRPYNYHDRVVAYYPPTYFNHVHYKNDDHGHNEGKGHDDRYEDHHDDHDHDSNNHDHH